ncbi:MAG: N-acyl-D-amino-acid deacylase family protein [Gammaproteobacteria bacterium]
MYDYLIKDATIVDGTGADAFSGNIAISNGKIVGVGEVTGEAKETVDAAGLYATPGWIDVHTHYDGQVSWDDKIDPSFSQGVTSFVMGNCGVGFAPYHPGTEKALIELMEGVEDIPGTALYEGIEWGRWETIPEYLDYLETRHFSMDIGALVPHSAVRNYVMGERAVNHEDATAEELNAICEIVADSLKAGALGFSTSRTVAHRSTLGDPIPGTFAEKDELLAIGSTMRKVGKGVFQAVPSGVAGDLGGPEKWTTEQEVGLFTDIAKASGLNCTFTLVQNLSRPDEWRKCLQIVEQANRDGALLTPQVSSRPIGFVTSLKTYHMFQRRPTYMKLEKLPLAERIAEMRKPEVRAAIVAEDDVPTGLPGPLANMHEVMSEAAEEMFPIDMPINYEPDAQNKMGVLAAAAGKTVPEYLYDFLTDNNGENFAIVMAANYVDGNFDVIEEMLQHPNTTIGLSDAGAHVNLIFDAVNPTYQISHWVRDRSRGRRMPIELIVHKQTLRNAELFGLHDRGSIEVGKRADLNLFDLNKLELGQLEVHNDLPAGGSRILQAVKGYRNTFVNGVKTRENDQDTGARPGRLIRG